MEEVNNGVNVLRQAATDRDYIFSHVFPVALPGRALKEIKNSGLYYHPLLDLLIVFEVILPSSEEYRCSFKVSNALLEKQDIPGPDICYNAWFRRFNSREVW